MDNYNGGIGLDEKRRKITCTPLKDLREIDEIGDFTTSPGNHLYAKEDEDGEMGFYRFRGYKDRNLNNRNIKPSDVGKDKEIRLERLSACHEEIIKNKIDEICIP